MRTHFAAVSSAQGTQMGNAKPSSNKWDGGWNVFSSPEASFALERRQIRTGESEMTRSAFSAPPFYLFFSFRPISNFSPPFNEESLRR